MTNWQRKTAQNKGHGNTLNGEMMSKELSRIASEVDRLRADAAKGGPSDVLPRWRQEVRSAIYLLPAVRTMTSMSMMELEQVDQELSKIKAAMGKYSAARFREIMDAR